MHRDRIGSVPGVLTLLALVAALVYGPLATGEAAASEPALPKLDTAQTAPPMQMDLSGSWELIDSRGKSSCRLSLTQTGSSVSGVAHYDTGTVQVSGTVAGGRVSLTMVYSDPRVMTKWISLAIAKQIRGIRGRADFAPGPNPGELTGTLAGWHVSWDANKKVTAWYHGGTPEAAKLNPPRAATLKRAEPPAAAGAGEAIRGACPWIDYIASGGTFKVVFDMTAGKFDDEGFTGDHRTDPMGTLKAGETYTVVFKNSKFTCTGYNEVYRKEGSFTYGGVDPKDGLISLWGRVFAFDGQGRVWDPDYGLVGRMRRAD